MMYRKFSIFLILVAVIFPCYGKIRLHRRQKKTADLIIFSFNRPMQLYAVLEGVQKYFSNLNNTYVLYRTTNQDYDQAYNEIKSTFNNVHFVKQGDNPRGDFKPLLLQCFFDSPAEYIMFSVDDDIVKDFVDLNECIEALEKSGAYGFYLRLGENITVQYNQDIVIGIPSYTEVKKDILKFKFNEGIGDWAYPHNVDMTIFKKSNIAGFYMNASYSSPNTLEGQWCGAADLNNYGLCFRESKKFMLPLNIVQQDWWVPNANLHSIEELFQKWKDGLKIDIDKFYQINNTCVLMGYKPIFIDRNS